MFDKYHLIHFNITTVLSDNNNAADRISMPPEVNNPEFLHAFEKAHENTTFHGQETFSLNGSFDYLMPNIYDGNIDNNYIHLQAFCILHNNKGYQTIRENYDSYLISYTLSGGGVLFYNDRTYHLRKNEGFIIDCRKYHEYYTSGDSWEHIDLHIDGIPAELLYKEFIKSDVYTFSVPENSYKDLVDNILSAYTTVSTHRKVYCHCAITALINYLLKAAEQTSESNIPDTYKYLIKYMESNYNSSLTLEQLAEFSCLSKYHMSREFKKFTGYSPIEYINRLRMQHAGLLLSQTSMTIEEICAEVGIETPSNFTYLFKKSTGMAPSTFRKTILNNITVPL